MLFVEYLVAATAAPRIARRSVAYLDPPTIALLPPPLLHTLIYGGPPPYYYPTLLHILGSNIQLNTGCYETDHSFLLSSFKFC